MTMNKITAADPETRSEDLIAGNIEQLKVLFPEAFTEGKLDFDVLRELLGGALEEREEKFGLNWYGKRKARQFALTPSTGTLRPCPDNSVNWDTTQNIMIEGDNLEALKLLQKSYAGKVKLIYIDPPYNTGNDFVYPDNFKDSIKNYYEVTGQTEGNKRNSSNTEANGRFHTDWLNMMYPRLKLAWYLLRSDGLLFISIDNSEVGNLRSICDELFGGENFIQQLVWKQHAGGGNDARHFASDHEYILVYCKNVESLGRLRMPLTEEDKQEYTQKDRNYPQLGPYKTKSFSRMRPDDPRPGLTYSITAPDGTKLTDTWKWEEAKFLRALAEDKVLMRKDRNGKWQVEYKIYLYSGDDENGDKEEKRKVPRSLLIDVERNAEGKKQLRELFNADNVFSNPKPVGLIKHLISFGCDKDGIVMDFFAGSGTTGQAVMESNAEDGGNRRFILVQLPEKLDPSVKGEEIAAGFCDKLGKPRNIAQLTIERLRRASHKVQTQNPLFTGDVGFRVFKLDSSNIRAWEPSSNNLMATLEESIEHIRPNRLETDILFELLIKLGLDLCTPIENKVIAGKTVHAIGRGVLLACLSDRIASYEVEALSHGIIQWMKTLQPAGDSTCVFRDSAFEDDVTKSNLAAILEQNGVFHMRSL